jgi:hypothetical protein
MDTGDHVIIVNASKVAMTGGKEQKKIAYRHSGYPGGITGTQYSKLLEEKPAFAVEKAVKGMLPKNKLGRAMVKKLHVVPGPEHPHVPQKPEPYTLGQPPVWGGLPELTPTELKTRHKATEKPEPSTGPAKKTTSKKTTARRPKAEKPSDDAEKE